MSASLIKVVGGGQHESHDLEGIWNPSLRAREFWKVSTGIPRKGQAEKKGSLGQVEVLDGHTQERAGRKERKFAAGE